MYRHSTQGLGQDGTPTIANDVVRMFMMLVLGATVPACNRHAVSITKTATDMLYHKSATDWAIGITKTATDWAICITKTATDWPIGITKTTTDWPIGITKTTTDTL